MWLRLRHRECDALTVSKTVGRRKAARGFESHPLRFCRRIACKAADSDSGRMRVGEPFIRAACRIWRCAGASHDRKPIAPPALATRSSRKLTGPFAFGRLYAARSARQRLVAGPRMLGPLVRRAALIGRAPALRRWAPL